MTDPIIEHVAAAEHFKATCFLEHLLRDFAAEVGVKRADVPTWTLGRRYKCRFCGHMVLISDRPAHARYELTLVRSRRKARLAAKASDARKKFPV